MKPIVSLLIPVYNSEDYLRDALDSVEKQDYENLEIIILDDGSTDSSPFIIATYKEKDPRIIVERGENRGIGRGRNRLLSLSSGEFVFFLDSDDILSSSSFISRLVLDAEKYESDVVSALTLPFRHKVKKKKDKGVRIYSGREFSSLMTKPFGFFCYPHSRLIRKSLFSSYPFPENMIFEDIPVMPWVIRESEKVVYDTGAVYLYRINKKGLSHNRFSSSSLFEMDGYYMNLRKAKEKNDNRISRYSSIFFLTKYYYYLVKALVTGFGVKEYQKAYKKKAKEAWHSLFMEDYR